MANPPYFTTHFDLAFPLPIIFSVDDFREAQNIFMMSDSILYGLGHRKNPGPREIKYH